MAFANWVAIADRLSPSVLTVRAATIPANDEGNLLWDLFFPREDVESVELTDLTAIDYRPVASRREWNAQGRLVPLPTPATRLVSIVPVEARDRIDEKEMQRMAESRQGPNEQALLDAMGAKLPQRADRLVESCYRRIEVDAMNAWALGTITQRNPEDASKTFTANFGFSGTRYTTASPVWSDAGLNAYNAFLSWLTAAQDLVGPVEGAMMRKATLDAILADAPALPNNVLMTRSQIDERISQDLKTPFQIVVNENSVDVFDDGGLTYTRTKVWPAQRVAAIPQGKVVGRCAFAPVARAGDLDPEVFHSGVNVRSVIVYHTPANEGKELAISAQCNALAIPDENRMAVINAGV